MEPKGIISRLMSRLFPKNTPTYPPCRPSAWDDGGPTLSIDSYMRSRQAKPKENACGDNPEGGGRPPGK